jgi:hypothetical protein
MQLAENLWGGAGLDELQRVELIVGLLSTKEHGHGGTSGGLASTPGEKKTDGSGDHVEDGSGLGGEDGGEVCDFHGRAMSLSAVRQVGISTKVAG